MVREGQCREGTVRRVGQVWWVLGVVATYLQLSWRR